MIRKRLLLQGGIGNQLLQVASLLSERSDYALDTSLVCSSTFQFCLRQRRVSNYLDHFEFSRPLTIVRRNFLLAFGLLLASKVNSNNPYYFVDYGHRRNVCEFLRQNVKLREPFQLKLQGSPTEDVAVHIRGGDYLLNKNSYFFKPQIDYYRSAIDEVGKFRKLCIFTDDEQYAREIFVDHSGSDLMFCSSADEMADFSSLSQFKRIICANSTFSLTAALVGQANFVFPKKYYSNERENPFLGICGATYV